MICKILKWSIGSKKEDSGVVGYRKIIAILVRTGIVGIMATVAFVAIQITDPSEAAAGCWPHIGYRSDTVTQGIPGGGTATGKAQVRGFYYGDMYCTHGESNSNTSVSIDYVYWYGSFYFGTVPSQVETGSGNCWNCTGGYWKSGAYWGPEGMGYMAKTYALHRFDEDAWYWSPWHWSGTFNF